MGSDGLGLTTGSGATAVAQIDSQAHAGTAIGLIETAIGKVNTQRANIGAVTNQLTYAADNMTNISSNVNASRSQIMDTDYAQATTQLAKTQIIQQAATAMLAQANQQPQSVLALLK
jgi:flagellin